MRRWLACDRDLGVVVDIYLVISSVVWWYCARAKEIRHRPWDGWTTWLWPDPRRRISRVRRWPSRKKKEREQWRKAKSFWREWVSRRTRRVVFEQLHDDRNDSRMKASKCSASRNSISSVEFLSVKWEKNYKKKQKKNSIYMEQI